MNMKDELHENLDNEAEVDRILSEHAMRWFGFGLGVGITVTCLFFGIFNLIK
jgi:uncharacterized membrane protein YdfJ with MMPL/SSD domain